MFDRKLLVGPFVSKILPLVPDGFRWFQMVSDGSRWFQMVAGNINALTINDLKLPETNWNHLIKTDKSFLFTELSFKHFLTARSKIVSFLTGMQISKKQSHNHCQTR
jgi:hypothetical protein